MLKFVKIIKYIWISYFFLTLQDENPI